MGLLLWRLLTLLVAALSMALSFCHVMEMAPRLLWRPELWMQATNFGGLYYLFGRIGAVIDIAAILAAAVLVFLSRRRRPAFALTLAGAVLFAIGLGIWIAAVAPMNAVMAHWSAGTVPPDFYQVRDRWEFGHAADWLAKFAGFTCLLLSVLVDRRERPA